jgi:hypothetical protein
MSDNIMSTHIVYMLLNKVLNTLVRKKFGKQYSVRLNSLHFIENRTNIYYLHNCLEKISLKSNKPVLISELESIEHFILYNINSALNCIEPSINLEVTEIELTII